jgi:large subunit ribosomal protein L10
LTKQQKNELIGYLTEEFKNSNSIVVADYKGSTVFSLEKLRNQCREKGIKVKVVKNTLASIAMKNAGVEGLELKDTNIVAWGNDQLEITKILVKYAESNSDKFAVKYGFIEGEVASKEKIDALSKLPSKEELIGMLLSVWTAPARMFVTGLDNLRKKLEEN